MTSHELALLILTPRPSNGRRALSSRPAARNSGPTTRAARPNSWPSSATAWLATGRAPSRWRPVISLEPPRSREYWKRISPGTTRVASPRRPSPASPFEMRPSWRREARRRKRAWPWRRACPASRRRPCTSSSSGRGRQGSHLLRRIALSLLRSPRQGFVARRGQARVARLRRGAARRQAAGERRGLAF